MAAGGFECARIIVPMDRRHPAAGTFSLPLARHRSTGTPEERIGSLVFNPGGPGASGFDYVPRVYSLFLPDEIKRRFDLVSWDPRGVGGSIPALTGCGQPNPVRPATGPVDWVKVARDFEQVLAPVNAACQKKNAAFVDHMSTVENVQDLDRIRAALGDDKLTYWGMSYGTRIAYVYALTFPERVRALVFDGSIDPAGTLIGLAEGGSAPDQAYGSFADAYPVAAAQLAAVNSLLNRRTVRLPDGARLNRWLMRDMVYGNIGRQRFYAQTADMANSFYTFLFGTAEQRAQVTAAAEQYTHLALQEPNYNAGELFSVVNCLDYADWPTLPEATEVILQQDRFGPVYGATLATSYALQCSGLTMRPDPVPVIVGNGPSVPVLVLGSSRDAATVQTWTGRMSRAFPASRTVTYAGGQHVTWGVAGSACVDAVANAYVTTLVLPAMDVGCSNAVTPQK
jgi:pimeloyl-ACP methyl ester carboxylesterase